MGACPSLKGTGTPPPHQLPEALPGPSDPQPGFEFRGDVVKEGLGFVIVAVGPQVVLVSRGLVTLGHHGQVLLFPFLSFVILKIQFLLKFLVQLFSAEGICPLKIKVAFKLDSVFLDVSWTALPSRAVSCSSVP